MLKKSIMALTGLLLLCGTVKGPSPLWAQEDGLVNGTTGIGLLLRKLDGVKRVLVIGAHPDDEDTSLLAALSRGMGVETAYLSLSRGEGGQNLIGDELDEGLGLLRTGELLAARSLDGGRQFFSRAFDFGYSKTAEETLRYWPREKLLADVTWVVRSFRPQVIVSVFSGTTRDGHGQHQVAGMMAQEAFEAAGNPEAFPEQLEAGVGPWAPSKLYRLARFGPGDISTEVETGRFDPLLGRSNYQLAMESRSQHRSQDMGRPQPLGPRSSRLSLLKSRVPLNGEVGDELFLGVDTTLVGLTHGLWGTNQVEVEAALKGYREVLSQVVEDFNALEPWSMTPLLLDGLAHLRGAEEKVGAAMGSGPAPDETAELSHALKDRISLVEEGVFRSAGVVVDVRLEDALLVPGEGVEGIVEVWNGGSLALEGVGVKLDVPVGWEVEGLEVPEGELGPGEMASWRFSLQLPRNAPLSRPYYMDQVRDGEMYQWSGPSNLWGEPGNPPSVHGLVRIRMNGTGSAEVRRPAIYRGVDKAIGEYVKPVLVVPALSVSLNPTSMAWPAGVTRSREFTVLVRNEAASGRVGSLFLSLPEGWRTEPEAHAVDLGEAGAEASFPFRVFPPEEMGAGEYMVGAEVRTDDGELFGEGVALVDYPHIQTRALFSKASARVSVFPVSVKEGLRVGYIMGSGDLGAEALAQMGLPVEILPPGVVQAGAFGGFDVIVLGIRAYETRPDVAAANGQLLDFARGGGTLVVQYNKYEFPRGGYAPYPVEMARPHDRVADETAPVRLLDPDHPLFRTPNQITQDDFLGWAQERGLYFLSEWDAQYTPLIEMSDPGEEAKQGGLMVALLGEGLYVYTGIAFFRQFPEGVPGAYRLFANLVSLTREDLGG
jgi:LmbE family N-acetylglucosaminyl deacetylase